MEKRFLKIRVNPCELIIICLVLLVSCSTTSGIPEGEQLFAGLKKISYENYEKGSYADSVITEMDYVLASVPTGAMFGSSYYMSPFPFRLWIWNAYANTTSGFGKWMFDTFGSEPKVLSEVNPGLRAQVAESQLMKNGYFNGKVSYDEITLRNPKKGKISYTVDMGPLWRLDSIAYRSFSAEEDSLIRSSRGEALIRKGSPFSVSSLESERQRLEELFQNNGYYYYQSGYASYLADTTVVPGKVQLILRKADSIDDKAQKKWYVGNIDINMRKEVRDSLDNEWKLRFLSLHFKGQKPPVRPGFVMRGMRLRHGRPYSLDNEQAFAKYLQSTGLFSNTSIRFTPRDTTAVCDTLDATVNLVFDKPYDFYIEANATGKSTGRYGPELVVGLTKKNAFHGGEKLDIDIHGSYEWQTGHQNEGSSTGVNSYEYGADASLTFPTIFTPWNLFRNPAKNLDRNRVPRRRRRFYATPTTTLKLSLNTINRSGYYRRHVVSGEITYDWWTSPTSQHSFSPLSIAYEFMNSKTADFDALLAENPYLQISMRDQFVPKMSYTYSYTSPVTYRSPVSWKTTVSEAGNIIAAGYAISGSGWSEEDKEMFKNPFAQFVKIETDFVKKWRLADNTSVVGHVCGGVVYSYGNSSSAPYYEQFYVGGANSIRAFNVRSVGPGKYVPTSGRYSYIDQTGDIKFQCNLEYRTRLWGSLRGALFLDAGNVWTLREQENREGGHFRFGHFLEEMAVGTGVGVRYDLGMFVVRLDWGVGLHVPYETGKSGFYNINKFSDAQAIHLAVGYPF